MLTPLMFWVLSGVGVAISIYSFIDTDNRVFAHIFAAMAATILFFLLAVAMVTGGVSEVSSVATTLTTVNSSMEYAYTTVETPMLDVGIGYFFAFVGVIMIIVTLHHVLSILGEMMQQRDRPWWSDYDEE